MGILSAVGICAQRRFGGIQHLFFANEGPINLTRNGIMEKTYNILVRRWLAAFTMAVLALGFCGCEQPQKSAPEAEVALGPIFFPPPPDKPRLQFLKSYSRIEDLGAETKAKKKKGGFESFILGHAEAKVTSRERIVKPYGVAISDGKIYVCDVGTKMINVLDLKKRTFTYLTEDRRLLNPVNIYVENGMKYVADSVAGSIFVFDRNDTLTAILGRNLKIRPHGIVVRENRIYVTDLASNQVVVMDKTSGDEILRIGKQGTDLGGFGMITGITLDEQGDIFVTDMLLGRITHFDKNGVFKETFGKLSSNFEDFVRPKGISLDREGRIWVVDAGTNVAKVYNLEGRLLMYFGLPMSPTETRGTLKLPAGIAIDYDNVDLFREYAVDGAELEFLVIVVSQFGRHKVSVFGFGTFPQAQSPGVAEPASPSEPIADDTPKAEPTEKQE